MIAHICIQEFYHCEQCRSAKGDSGCAHGLLFPVLLVMNNMSSCPNFELDIRKMKIESTTIKSKR